MTSHPLFFVTLWSSRDKTHTRTMLSASQARQNQNAARSVIFLWFDVIGTCPSSQIIYCSACRVNLPLTGKILLHFIPSPLRHGDWHRTPFPLLLFSFRLRNKKNTSARLDHVTQICNRSGVVQQATDVLALPMTDILPLTTPPSSQLVSAVDVHKSLLLFPSFLISTIGCAGP